MARRYDGKTTTFSQDGRLYQVEYAMESISHAGACIGILAKDGIVLIAEKKVTSKLLDTLNQSEKMYKLDNHVVCSVAGITSDANVLVNFARKVSQNYTYTYQQPIPIEHLVVRMCDLKQGYTQYGGQRPFGVAFLFAGWDKLYGFQLYQSDPSGNYSGWKAYAVGNGNVKAQTKLKSDYKDDMTIKEAIELAIKCLAKALDTTTFTSEKVELSTLTKDERGNIVFKTFKADEIDELIKSTDLTSEEHE